MQNWVVIDERYLNYLRAAEPRIPHSDYGTDKMKPFFGVLFEQGELAYVTQISHAQERHKAMRNMPDFIKIYIADRNPALPDRLAAVVNLNYMFPVPKAEMQEMKYKDIEQHRTFRSLQEKSRYIDLLSKELAQINTLDMETKAKKVYHLKQQFPENFVSRRCLDFERLEALALAYPAKADSDS